MTRSVDPMLALSLDRSLPLPVGVQLRGQIEYGITTGEIARGTRLPSVRDLAAALRLSPATVSQVYKGLREHGLLESRPGRGTFVVQRLPPAQEAESVVALRRAVDGLLTAAERLGFSRAAVAEAVALRAGRASAPERGLRVLFVGVYEGASEGYAASIRSALRSADAIEWTTFDRLRRSGREPLGADAYLTLANREGELRELVGKGRPVVGLTFIPSRETRTRLAQLSADARVAAVTNVPEFLPTLQRNVTRYAPHVGSVRGGLAGAADLRRLLRWCTAVVYGTGTAAVLERVPHDADAFEFRFEPEAHTISSLLLPTLEAVRRGPPTPPSP